MFGWNKREYEFSGNTTQNCSKTNKVKNVFGRQIYF